MVRPLGLPRIAGGLVFIPYVACLAVACGGSDYVDPPDAATSGDESTPDAASDIGAPDTAPLDATVIDGSSRDSGAMDATLTDTALPDADGAETKAEADAKELDAEHDADAAREDAAIDAGKGVDADAESADAESPDAGRPDSDVVAEAEAEAGVDATVEAEASVDATLEAEASVDTGSVDANEASLEEADAPREAEASILDATADTGTSNLFQSLGTGDPFVVLAAATITNSGISTVLIGDIGTTGPSVTGLVGPPFQPSGTTEVNNARARQALLDVGTAYTALAGTPCPPANNLTGQDLGGMTLAPGVYCFSSTAGQTGATTLTFDAKGDPNAVWIIQIGTALTVMDNVNAVVIGGPPELACRIFWTMGTAATIGNAHFLGNLIASSTTTMQTNATLSPGRAIGLTAGVTLLSNTISIAACP